MSHPRSRVEGPGALLVGSVNLPTAEDVFRAAGERAGDVLKRIPDGETGPRQYWTDWQLPVFSEHEAFEPGPMLEYGIYHGLDTFQLRDKSLTSDDLELRDPGYAPVAVASYEILGRLKDEGVVPADTLLQVSMPTPFSVLGYVYYEDHPVVEPVYEARMLEDLDRMFAQIPHQDLALQWDCFQETMNIEGIVATAFSDIAGGLAERLVRLGEHVPADVELGYHLCYGSWHDEHAIEPKDAAVMVDFTNRVLAGLSRAPTWWHMPVPIDRTDAQYFEPLAELELADETDLYLGLLHIEDGVEGSMRRARAARPFVERFGVAAECGFGRVDEDKMVPYMDLHSQAYHALMED